MTTQLRIGQVAKATGLTEKTIRFYEEIHLIEAPTRGENGYRIYSVDAVESLKMIKYARDLGIPIEKIKKLLLGCEGKSCAHSKEYVDTEIIEQLQSVEVRIRELTVLKEELTSLKTTLATTDTFCTEGKYCCNILHQLLELKKGGNTHAKK